jgi:hypothetical protein
VNPKSRKWQQRNPRGWVPPPLHTPHSRFGGSIVDPGPSNVKCEAEASPKPLNFNLNITGARAGGAGSLSSAARRSASLSGMFLPGHLGHSAATASELRHGAFSLGYLGAVGVGLARYSSGGPGVTGACVGAAPLWRSPRADSERNRRYLDSGQAAFSVVRCSTQSSRVFGRVS